MKGHTNNPNGRPKGKPNKITGDLKKFLKTVIDNNQRQINKDLKALNPKDRLLILEKFMSYVVPKQQQQQVIDFSHITDAQLNDVIEGLTENINENEQNDEV
ncbi:MAG: hypothetical protein J5676_06265 [Bacteroidaceae bacterium]|nr:hypothetical protein [Bacteroidaceae bacterium]